MKAQRTRGDALSIVPASGRWVREAGAQLASLMYYKRSAQTCFAGFTRIEDVRFRGQVTPGDDLLLLSNPSSTVGRKNLSIHASLDGGHEWQPLVVVEDRGKRGSGCTYEYSSPLPSLPKV